jgi:hypothetical protein
MPVSLFGKVPGQLTNQRSSHLLLYHEKEGIMKATYRYLHSILVQIKLSPEVS